MSDWKPSADDPTKIEVPPNRWNDYRREDLEFRLELGEHDATNDYPDSGWPSKLEVYVELPQLQARVNEIVSDPNQEVCCSIVRDSRGCAWTDCHNPGTLCPLFSFANTEEGNPWWTARHRYIRVRAFLKENDETS